MAGKKGCSGGPRPNSGGTRPGSGRPKNPAPKVGESVDLHDALMHRDPKAFLLAVMNDPGSDAKLRVDAAKALMPYMHQKLGEGGKKEQAVERAKGADAGTDWASLLN